MCFRPLERDQTLQVCAILLCPSSDEINSSFCASVVGEGRDPRYKTGKGQTPVCLGITDEILLEIWLP